MRILLIGGSGRLGQEVSIALQHSVLLPTHQELDVTNYASVSDYLRKTRPEVVLHLAALTDVRYCEINKDLAWKVNVKGTENVVRACEENKSMPMLAYASTPCVFAGDNGPYSESSPPHPQNHYGISKAEAERIVLRYSNSLVFRSNFVPRAKWKYTKAFVDRYGTYLFADEVSFVVSQLPNSNLRGIVHIVGKDKMSMFELARITSPDVLPMTMKDIDIKLTVDMSMISERINAFTINRSLIQLTNYEAFRISPKN